MVLVFVHDLVVDMKVVLVLKVLLMVQVKRGSEKCCKKTFSTTELYVQRVGENLEENLVENPFCYKNVCPTG